MTQTCPNCKKAFDCQVSDSEGCWCSKLPAIAPLKDTGGCLCPNCLTKTIQAQIEQFVAEFKAGKRTNTAPQYRRPGRPVEGIDYYMENGLFVMTSWSHLKRGHCCGSGCRHCPYPKD
ncbi:MAG: cysteine-rich CWC family protein [Mameliella sp.]|nr:cysteine-rich CWC family protein [Phaeodactylibacter sp.]